jgi:imidazolonepropionase-like amidohydrolase
MIFRLQIKKYVLIIALIGCINSFGQTTILSGITLIDGNGGVPKTDVDLVIQGDRIGSILIHHNTHYPGGSKVIDLEGKTIMPVMINAHGHLGYLKGWTVTPDNYTKENIERQLKKYESFGIGMVLSLGTDREMIFGLRDSSRQGKLPGAMFLTAGYGFGAPGGPAGVLMEKIFRPVTSEEAIHDVRQLSLLKPDIIKMWVDDFGGKSPKIKPEIYEAIIKEAHRTGLRVAAHIYYLEDARKLVAAGVDVLAHSIRDKEIDDALVKEMKLKAVVYIPTLSLDEYNFIYATQPSWMSDKFFQASLEPGVLDTLKTEAYLKRQENDPDRQKKLADFQTALHNLQKIFKGGVKVVMGTDSGAQPVRTQGFSEHLELELMVQAGLSPSEVITCATRRGAEFLKVNKLYGTLELGKKADFIILNDNPLVDIKNTRSIISVWRNGVKVSDGPIDNRQ